jgi:hypothetical protein
MSHLFAPILRAVEDTRSRRLRGAVVRWMHRVRVAEAMMLLGLASIAQHWIPMPRWSSILGKAAAVPSAWQGEPIDALPLGSATPAEAKAVKAIRSASRRVPWKPTCLAEATAGQLLLRQLGAPGVVVIGLRARDEVTSAGWDAHAWLLGRHGALTGGPAARGFTATTLFEVAGGLSASEVDVGAAARGDGVQPSTG